MDAMGNYQPFYPGLFFPGYPFQGTDIRSIVGKTVVPGRIEGKGNRPVRQTGIDGRGKTVGAYRAGTESRRGFSLLMISVKRVSTM